MRAVKLSRAYPSSTLLLASPNPKPNLSNEAFSAQKARPLWLHRSYSPARDPNPDLCNEAPANLSAQKGLEELSDYAFDRLGVVPWRKELHGQAEVVGKLGQGVSLFHSVSGIPCAKSSLKLDESHCCLVLIFRGDAALVAAAYLAEHDCILASGKLFCASVEASIWGLDISHFKYVQTEHHNGHIPEGFVREPQMEKLSTDRLHATWREFFNDPSQWSDNRSKQGHYKCLPDFTHKTLGYGLRVRGCRVPFWVKKRLRHFDACRNAQLNDDDRNACKEGDTSRQGHGNISLVGETDRQVGEAVAFNHQRQGFF